MHAPEPRFATPRDPDAPSDGAQIAAIAQLLGKPLMPWQRRVVDVATERDASGRYRYPRVLVTVPRQSGKTTLMTAVQVHRIMFNRGAEVYFTAQTGKDAGDLVDEMQKILRASPLSHLFDYRRAAGSKGFACVESGSRFSMFSVPDNMHGKHPELVVLDEIWAHDQARGVEFMGAIKPAQSTLFGKAQLWMVSTMGTANSGFMNGLLEQGRRREPGLAYFEWSMPEGGDPYDPQTWWTFHPALGNTIDIAALEDASHGDDMTPGEWMRAYMNRLTEASDPLIDADEWAAMAGTPDVVPSRRDLTITFEVAPGGETAAVLAVWRDKDTGKACARVLHSAPGTAWLVRLLEQIDDEWRPAQIAADDAGENRPFIDELRRAGHDVYTPSFADFAAANAQLLNLARGRELLHDGSRTLADAVARAVLQPAGEGVKFSRRRSAGPIPGLIAYAVGVWAHDHREAPLGPPVLRF